MFWPRRRSGTQGHALAIHEWPYCSSLYCDNTIAIQCTDKIPSSRIEIFATTMFSPVIDFNKALQIYEAT